MAKLTQGKFSTQKNSWAYFWPISRSSTLSKLPVFRHFTSFSKNPGKFGFGFGTYVKSNIYPIIFIEIWPKFSPLTWPDPSHSLKADQHFSSFTVKMNELSLGIRKRTYFKFRTKLSLPDNELFYRIYLISNKTRTTLGLWRRMIHSGFLILNICFDSLYSDWVYFQSCWKSF